MDLDRAITELRRRNEPVPKPARLPTAAEVDEAERLLATRFHPDFRRYLLEASDVNYGTKEPVTLTLPGAHTDLHVVMEDARQMGVPPGLVPICEDNGDFYCVNDRGEVLFWSHDGHSEEKWSSIAEWIELVWLGEAAE
jgi:hypothetical protein